MSIHSTLAVLLGSTALGRYSPLTVQAVARSYVLGMPTGGMALIDDSLFILEGIAPNAVRLQESRMSAIIAPNGQSVVEAMLHTVIGLYGAAVFEVIMHAFGKPLTDGYGFHYGENYGSNS